MSAIERLKSDKILKASKPQALGKFLTTICALLITMKYLKGVEVSAFWWALFVCLAFCTAFAPRILRPVEILLIKLGQVLEKIISPLIWMLIYFILFTPVGVLRRIFSPESFAEGIDKKRTTYWSAIDPNMHDKKRFRWQF